MKFDNYTIRLLSNEDLEMYFQLIERNRKRLEDGFAGTVSRTLTLESTQLFVAERVSKIIEKTYFPFIVVDNGINTIVGFIDVKNIEWNIPKGELGCYVDAEYAGKGLSTRALQMVTDYCFKELGFRKLFLRTQESNTSARRIAEKCGFEIEGKIRQDYKTFSGQIVDLLYYGKLSKNV